MNSEGISLENSIIEGLKDLKFTGKSKDAPKVAVHYVNAYENIWNIIRSRKASIGKEDSKIFSYLFTGGLREDAGLWKNNEQRKDLATANPEVGIEVWMERFRKRYIPHTYMEDLTEELYNLKERGDITSYANKFAELEETIGNLPKDEADRLFIHGLSFDNKIRCKGIVTTREDIIDHIRTIEGWQKQKGLYSHRKNKFKGKGQAVEDRFKHFEANGNKRYKKSCFECGSTTHFVAECPTRKQGLKRPQST